MEKKATSFGGSLPVPCVQELANRPLTSVPPRYVHHDQDPLIISLNSSSSQVPVIDMQRLLSEDFQDSELHKLDCACKEWGFFQLINHEVSSCLVEKFKSEIEDFFKLPIEEKNKYKQQEGDIEGYGNTFVVSEEQKLDWGDMLLLTTLPIHLRRPHLLPNLPLSFSVLHVSYRLWRSFDKSLQEKCSSATPSRRHQFSTLRRQMILVTPKQVSPPRRPSPVAE